MANKTSKKNNKEPDIIERRKPAKNPDDEFIKRSKREKKAQVSESAPEKAPTPPNPDSIGNQAMVFVMAVCAIFFAFCLLLTNMSKGTDAVSGPVGYNTCKVIYGLFGYGAYLIPIVFALYAAYWNRCVVKGTVLQKIVISVFIFYQNWLEYF